MSKHDVLIALFFAILIPSAIGLTFFLVAFAVEFGVPLARSLL